MENLTGYLYDFAAKNPDKPAILHPQKVTFRELCRLIDCYASGFQRCGISIATKTIVLIKPGVDLFAVVFALLRIGAIPVLIDPGMGNKAMALALSGIDAEAFIAIPTAHLLRLACPEAFKTVKIKISTSFPTPGSTSTLFKIRKSGIFGYDVCLTKPTDDAAIFFTSGSTGPAKAVVYKNYMLYAQIGYLTDHFKYSPDDIDLCTFPLIGLLVINLGISVVLADMDTTRPVTLKPRNLIRNISQYGCSTMFCSPLVLRKLKEYASVRNITLHSLKKVFSAGAPVAPSLVRNFKKLLDEDAVIHTPYGATEALSITDVTDDDLLSVYGDSDAPLKGICIGKPLNEIRLRLIKITDDPIHTMNDIEEAKIGEVGEIAIIGLNVTQSYLQNDRANRLSKMANLHSSLLWHRTGDLGRMDPSGYLWYYGRKSHRVETPKGIYFTIPCEAVFNQHPDVLRSALVSVTVNNEVTPLICIELKKGIRKSERLKNELMALAFANHHTREISRFLFHPDFPVDPRHNAKIFREKLAVWAQQKLQ